MSAVTVIPVSGGLVTAKDPALLDAGELTRADDAEYHPNDPALWKIRGRAAFNSTAEASSIKGLRYLEFDGGTDLLVAHVGTAYRQATAATSGTFSDLVTGLTGGDTLDSIHYANEHFLFNGVDRTRVIASGGTVTLHGMTANASAPTVSRDAGSGTGMTITSGSTIKYWVEERVKSGSTILKRNAATSATVLTHTGDGTLDKPVITRPTTVNSEATHWALYGTATNGSFPTGAEISEVVIATTTIEDTRSGADPVIPSGETYETIAVSIAGVTSTTAKHTAPPVASTGDVMEDSLVVNDTSDTSQIAYSVEDEPHAFPSVYRIKFETKEADEVLCIRVLGRSIVVLMRNSAWRVDTLPRAHDAAFATERVKEQIHGAHGGVGVYCAAVFSYGEGVRLAYISRYGLLMTDGYVWDVVSDDLDWRSTWNIGSLSSAFLRYNPVEYRLEMFGLNAAGTRVGYYFHVHPSHRKNGPSFRAKVTGPINFPATSGVMAHIGGEDIPFGGIASGTVYQEGAGAASAGGSLAYVCRTRKEHPAGYLANSAVRRVAVHHTAAATSTQTGTAYLARYVEGEDVMESALDSVSLRRNEPTTVFRQGNGEGFVYGLSNSDALGAFAVNGFLVEYEGLSRARP